MRTTVTLDPDINERVKRYGQRRRLAFKAALNSLLRRGLAVSENEQDGEFVVQPHISAFRSGIDLNRLNHLADELDTHAFASKALQ